VSVVAFTPDGTGLSVCDQNGAIFLWGTGTGRLVHTQVVNKDVTALAFAPGGTTMATGDDNGDLTLWHIS
jgi:WD40 repeat protein